MFEFIAAGESADPLITGFAQLGVAGVLLAMLLMFGKQVLKRESDRADANAAEVARLNASIQKDYIPSLLEGQRALQESNRVLGEVKDSLVELRVTKKRGSQ